MTKNSYDFALTVVRDAGKLLRDVREKEFNVSIKGNNPRDIVTSADIEVNEHIITAIKKAFPKDGIVSEEGGGIEKTSRRQWVIDPIDGSANFSRGIPHFAVCLGLVENGESVLGAVYNPVTNELFSFEKGKGAFLNGKAVRVSDMTELSHATVFLSAGRKKENWDWGGVSYRKLLEHTLKVKNLGSSSLDICFVAAGRIEACVSGAFTTRDVAPALGFLYEAGGVASNARGDRLLYSNMPEKVFVANNKTILDSLRVLLMT